MHSFTTSIAPLLPLLRCPVCVSEQPLTVVAGPATAVIDLPQHDQHLRCAGCGTQFPISHDLIPIMWDEEVRKVFAHVQDADDTSLGTLRANMEIYDAISDDYNLYSRVDPRLPRKIQAAAKRVFPSFDPAVDASVASPGEAPRYHLDFGCGPGHVISWLGKLGFLQIGLDLSLKNLRNARKQTGCLVICGSACNMPIATASMDLVTESSALHHIHDWQRAVRESIRVCRQTGGVVLDHEPTEAQMALSALAVNVFDARFRVYQLLSYVMREKFVFRDAQQARLNAQAEVHHQPGMGFPLDELEGAFRSSGFEIEIILSPSANLEEVPTPNWKEVLLSLLCPRNPWNPAYGNFTAIGRGPAAK
jgi:SAM-dependent methyltransferase/uncharacterized protein YbaR (Trm112 family)